MNCYNYNNNKVVINNNNNNKYLLTRWYLRIPNRSKKINNSYESALFNTLQLTTVENIYVPVVINFVVFLGRQINFYSSLSTLSQRFLSHYVIYLWKYAHRWRWVQQRRGRRYNKALIASLLGDDASYYLHIILK